MTVSNRRLVLFLALAIVPIVVLVVGPFRGRFFPHDVIALRELAHVEAPRLDEAGVHALAGAKFESAGDRAWLAELADDAQAQRWDQLVERLDSLPPERVTPGLMYLHGMAALLARRPAVAIAGLEAASRAADPELAHAASFALAQAFLMLDRGDAAHALLSELARRPGAHANEAAQQLAQLDSWSRPR